ncbi:hypothetical protein ACS60E_03170 [Streptococcus suis]
MKEIIKTTRFSIESKRLINQDPSKLYNKIGEASLNKRESYRDFKIDKKTKLTKSDLYDFYRRFTELLYILNLDESIVSLCLIDNKGVISKQKKMYKVLESDFVEIETNGPINRDSLYIQEEMHDAGVVIFFLWESKILQEDYCRYKDVLLMSGFLGHQIQILATKKDIKGTMFAGVTLVEFYGVTDYDFDSKIPIFAVALE